MRSHIAFRLATLAIAIVSLSILVPSSTIVHAYGPAQWQATFSGNFTNPGANATGFWGWCDFAGSATDGQSGTSADCQVTFYFHSKDGPSSPTSHMSVSGTAWSMQPSTMPGPPGSPPNDFFVTDGTVTFSGPFIHPILAAGPAPPGCTIRGETGTCPIPTLEAIHAYNPDTGIPAAPGHFSLAGLLETLGVELPAGSHINFQVNQLP